MWFKVLAILPLLASARVSAECMFDGVAYRDRATAPTCLILVCRGDTWVATGDSNSHCKRCSGHNDPHWHNFEGFYFDFHGTCNYSVAVSGGWGVYGDFKQCNNFASCFNIITYKDGPHTVITLDKDDSNLILVNGDSFSVDGVVRAVQSSGPTTHNVLAWKHDANCIRVVGTLGISLSFCGWGLYVWASNAVVGSLSGLCTSDHSFDTSGLTPGSYTPLLATYNEIYALGDSLKTTGTDCALDPNYSEGEGPTGGTGKPLKRDVSLLPTFCSAADVITFLNECQALFSAVGDAGNPRMVQMYAEFCMFDLCSMKMSFASAAEMEAWKHIMLVMFKTTIEAIENVKCPKHDMDNRSLNIQVIQKVYF